MRRVLVFTGSRGEWGYLRPVLDFFESHNLEPYIVATNMHVDPAYGSTGTEIEADGFCINERLPMTLSYETKYRWSHDLGVLANHIPGCIERADPDLILIAGDRAETMMIATLAYYTSVPICHIQAGEKSGHKDGAARHAIGKLVHLHFASNADAVARLLSMGEEPFRVHNVGAPQLDDLLDLSFVDKGEEVVRELEVVPDFALVVFHNTVEDENDLQTIVADTHQFLSNKVSTQVWILPNSDAGSDALGDLIVSFNRQNMKVVRNLPRNKFAYLLRNCRCIIGNSSVGILEAPAMGTWSINIGHRQEGRFRSATVIDIEDFSIAELERAFNATAKGCTPDYQYGRGASAEKICKLLKDVEINQALINKRITI